MTRRKVAPEKRLRGVRACRPCKASKRRCDSALPCSACVRRNCAAACGYGPATASRPAQAAERVHAHEDAPPTLEPASAHPTVSALSDTAAATGVSCATTAGSPTATQSAGASPTARMMRNAKGENFLFGDAAGVSFLQFMRKVVLQYMGACQFTEDKRQDVILEVDMPDDWQPCEPAPDMRRSKTLTDNFFIGTAGILNVYSKEQTLQLVRHLGRPGRLDDRKTSIGCLVVAIGAQCLVQNTDMTAAERTRYFKRGQQLAFAGMLENVSVDVVYAFLLMSFYLLGACRRNTAFLYIGIAARSAHALGLHAPEHFGHLAREEQSQRIRAWESLRVIDLIVASVLCRPPASLAYSAARQTSAWAHAPDLTARHLAVYANVQLCFILEDVVQHMDQKKRISPPAALAFLGQLQRWSESLPPVLRKFSAQAPLTPAAQEMAIGNLSISCQYYFAVILVTRSALITEFLSKLESDNTAPDRHPSCSVADVQCSRETAKLARMCVDAAVLMANVCRDAMAVGILLDNMCMLKAWIFSASLILGFAWFHHYEQPRPEISHAFRAAVRTLDRLATPSGCPQAAHYVAVLNNLAAAVAAYHQKMASHLRASGGPFVSQLLVIDVPEGEDGSDTDQTTAEAVVLEPPDESLSAAATVLENMSNWFPEQAWNASSMARDFVAVDASRLPQMPLMDESLYLMENFALVFDEF